MSSLKVLWLSVILSFVALAGCDRGTSNPVSDVPCLEPRDWPDGRVFFLVRVELDAPDVLLLAHQTGDQSWEDGDDGIIGNGAHGPVYLLDSEDAGFELVADSMWDEAEGPVKLCIGDGGRETPFSIQPLGAIRPELNFDGRTVPVAGGTTLAIIPGPNSDRVAVVSTDGIRKIWFLSGTGASGQHYHQLFSEVDGSAIGSPVRLGVGGFDTSVVDGCWTADEEFIIYSQSKSGESGFDLLCVVDVQE